MIFRENNTKLDVFDPLCDAFKSKRPTSYQYAVTFDRKLLKFVRIPHFYNEKSNDLLCFSLQSIEMQAIFEH